ncbi:restriction endonuclease subunit S [Planococcus sp. APC 3906]|uniref:restriction endonuclease subunit S n=1 Tax=Planococcus sp. APC 3906 TaxID=3035194 RepID=UPI0025B35135|nr:restriction endonuclease subunit S [Planococcus sp. APC 3906]MDN3451553.1 restriction endonuclease subunit S [Planococcus sp. APC 3906]
MNVPQLRFEGFSEEYERKKIGDFLAESREIGSKGDTAAKLTVKLWGKGIVPKREAVMGSANTQYYRRRAGQLMYGKLDFLNNAFGIVPKELDGYESTIDSPAFDIENINSEFLLNYIMRKDFYKKNGEKANGSRKAKRIHPEDFFEMPISIPSIEEQNRIGYFTRLLEARIVKHQEKIEQLEQFKKRMMQKIFSQELRFRDDDSTWEKLRLRDVCTISSGKRLPKGHSFSQEGIPYISVSDMGEKYVEKVKFSFIAQDTEKILNKYKVNTGDVIISIAGTLGKINLIDDSLDNANLTENCNKITGFKNVINTYIYYCLKSEAIQRKIKEVSTTSSQPKLALDRLRDFYIFVPAIKEQHKISEFLIALDKKIEKEKEKLMVLEEQKKGFLQGMFV